MGIENVSGVISAQDMAELKISQNLGSYNRLLPAQWEGWGKGKKPLSGGSDTQDVRFSNQTGIGSQNVEPPPLRAPQRRGWGRNLGAPYAKPRSPNSSERLRG